MSDMSHLEPRLDYDALRNRIEENYQTEKAKIEREYRWGMVAIFAGWAIAQAGIIVGALAVLGAL